MFKFFKYIFLLFFFTNIYSNNIVFKKTEQSKNYLFELKKNNNYSAIQNENTFILRASNSSSIVVSQLKKPYLNFLSLTFVGREIINNESLKIQENICNNVFLYFLGTDIINPFHSFW